MGRLIEIYLDTKNIYRNKDKLWFIFSIYSKIIKNMIKKGISEMTILKSGIIKAMKVIIKNLEMAQFIFWPIILIYVIEILY